MDNIKLDLELKRNFIERARSLYPNNQLLNIGINASISEVVAAKNLEESLSEAGLKKAQDLFGGLAEVNLEELIAYCDFTENLPAFIEMLKPEVLENIRSNFKVLNNQTWLLEKDGRNLEILTGVFIVNKNSNNSNNEIVNEVIIDDDKVNSILDVKS